MPNIYLCEKLDTSISTSILTISDSISQVIVLITKDIVDSAFNAQFNLVCNPEHLELNYEKKSTSAVYKVSSWAGGVKAGVSIFRVEVTANEITVLSDYTNWVSSFREHFMSSVLLKKTETSNIVKSWMEGKLPRITEAKNE